MNALEVNQVKKAYGTTRILENISLSVESGAFVVIVGPSGCGKTTLLRILAGLEDVDEGSLRLGSRDITAVAPAARNVAMVFQNYALYPTKTVRQNLSFGLRQRKTPAREIARRVGATAKMLRIEQLMERRPSQLSGGQRQRVAIGRAMVREPSLFLFDEPLSNLDAALRSDLRLEIKRIHNLMGATSVYVTHDQLEAMSLADILVVMRDGRIEQVGSPSEIFRKPASRFVASFIGNPLMDFLPAKVAGGMLLLPDGSSIAADAAAALADLAKVDMGFRADDLTIVPLGEAGSIPARVDIVQELGTTRIVYVITDAGPFSISQSSDIAPPSGQVGVRFRPDRIMLFDPATGGVIGGGD
ncbi:sn-glycerol-3-phosphate ABC transporter ATP-binding protein UgpC [Falsochrobactrum shanghaiense]|uniref:sn-glycerol-3-phosphate ABC transporter ATP-binding protein UgpC n=1 Tax=Falsochrobactrum shanghaiense TaxID=2201899 RepID=A0A316JCA5_9HYPH|nr:ATP-binding cassette domain-containing protein [Falsochrobactrum shanghaiense]PWL18305.1 sn-glycerol-3-phosphate ABC transporter ATP-binding protein UgpC [Falsochrobactrum shanghaiense]